MAGMLLSLAAKNPLMFFGLIIGGALVFGLLFGIGFLVSGAIKLTVGVIFAVVLFLGLFQLSKGHFRMGALLVVIAIGILAALLGGWVG